MAVKTRQTHFIVEGAHEFETTFKAIEGTEKVTIAGDKAVVAYLADDSAQSGWYFDENDQGTFLNLDSRCRGAISRKAAQEALKANPDRAFVINKYEHGQVRYYRQINHEVSATIPDQQWDVSHGCAVYIAPDDVPNPGAYCDSVMEEFTNWCNGEVYGVCSAVYTKSGDTWIEETSDECWGFIGGDNARLERDARHKDIFEEVTTKETT